MSYGFANLTWISFLLVVWTTVGMTQQPSSAVTQAVDDETAFSAEPDHSANELPLPAAEREADSIGLKLGWPLDGNWPSPDRTSGGRVPESSKPAATDQSETPDSESPDLTGGAESDPSIEPVSYLGSTGKAEYSIGDFKEDSHATYSEESPSSWRWTDVKHWSLSASLLGLARDDRFEIRGSEGPIAELGTGGNGGVLIQATNSIPFPRDGDLFIGTELAALFSSGQGELELVGIDGEFGNLGEMTADLSSFEWNALAAPGEGRANDEAGWKTFVGVKYIYSADAKTILLPVSETMLQADRYEAANHLFGMHLGARRFWHWKRLSLGGDVRGGLFANAYSQSGPAFENRRRPASVVFESYDESGVGLAPVLETHVRTRLRITENSHLGVGGYFLSLFNTATAAAGWGDAVREGIDYAGLSLSFDHRF